MGRHIPRGRDPTVVWYDAVTTEGKLQWQNGVTAKNKPFLEDCDGILCNYGWVPAALPVSKLVAGAHRCGDVYLGIDVHGRGTYGGGGWGCGEALTAARTAGMSACLFAPGWVLENEGEGGFPANQKRYVTNLSYYTLYTPFIHLYIAVHTPMYTRYACIYTIYTPYIHHIYTIHTPNTPLNTPYTP